MDGSILTQTQAPGWDAAGAPCHLGAARLPSGDFVLVGLDAEGGEVFRLPLPDRGHAAAVHPTAPLAVGFARRPGTFGVVVDCLDGREIARLETPDGVHFMGHGCISADGHLLYTPENDYERERGILGVWDVRDWRRIGEMPSGGLGPHDVIEMADGVLAVANGGIFTHPAMERQKLNLASMRPNLAYLCPRGEVLEALEPPERQASLRHIAMRADGTIAAAMQWEGEAARAPAVLALHRRGEPALRLLEAPAEAQARLKGYGGSVAFSGDGRLVAATSPRGGVAHLFDADTGAFVAEIDQPDVCGAAPAGAGLLLSDGMGWLRWIGEDGRELRRRETPGLAWDNHLVRVAG
ncbi:DUF1513 domain-containing protein [Albimonas sp. CAU 1670]|uniref:DUF1513 domain-containing protein n=1 Tax=Albimonas sp. CAU 1670 TaxID=3032599 RepID=UPI0023DBEEB0|nr:DUF1513 domain-containing protein [Albimonas sp. CAU 1670]MDF2232304.1 DUF1513 domain-containing protein [Albimonas sp. CAU 1670]